MEVLLQSRQKHIRLRELTEIQTKADKFRNAGLSLGKPSDQGLEVMKKILCKREKGADRCTTDKFAVLLKPQWVDRSASAGSQAGSELPPGSGAELAPEHKVREQLRELQNTDMPIGDAWKGAFFPNTPTLDKLVILSMATMLVAEKFNTDPVIRLGLVGVPAVDDKPATMLPVLYLRKDITEMTQGDRREWKNRVGDTLGSSRWNDTVFGPETKLYALIDEIEVDFLGGEETCEVTGGGRQIKRQALFDWRGHVVNHVMEGVTSMNVEFKTCLETALERAIQAESREAFKDVLFLKGMPNNDKKGRNLLHYSVSDKSVKRHDFLHFLLSQDEAAELVCMQDDAGVTSLFHAISVQAPYEVIRLLMKKGGKEALLRKKNDGNTVLHWVCLRHQKELFQDILMSETLNGQELRELLLARNNTRGWTFLHFVERSGNSEIFELLQSDVIKIALKEKLGLNNDGVVAFIGSLVLIENKEGETALDLARWFHSSTASKLDLIHRLSEFVPKTPLPAPAGGEEHRLIEAVQMGDKACALKIVQNLPTDQTLRVFAAPGEKERTALHVAALLGRHEICEAILDKAAHLGKTHELLKAEDAHGQIALQLAVSVCGWDEHFTEVLEARNDLETRKVKTIRALLLRHGVALNFQKKLPILPAVIRGSRKICEALLPFVPANVSITSFWKDDPLSIACYWGHNEVADLLLTQRQEVLALSNITKPNSAGSTPLHYAAENAGMQSVLRKIVNSVKIPGAVAGVDAAIQLLEKKNAYGNSAADLARRKNLGDNVDELEVLLKELKLEAGGDIPGQPCEP